MLQRHLQCRRCGQFFGYISTEPQPPPPRCPRCSATAPDLVVLSAGAAPPAGALPLAGLPGLALMLARPHLAIGRPMGDYAASDAHVAEIAARLFDAAAGSAQARGLSPGEVDALPRAWHADWPGTGAPGAPAPPADGAACAVCQEGLWPARGPRGVPFAELVSLPACGHAFHAECIVPWLLRVASCPVCRHEVRPPSA